jgi:tetratricopeptide (TPR) repeat protein
MADRYTYFPLVGLFVLLVWSVADLKCPPLLQQRLLTVGSPLLICICAVWTASQLRFWSSSVRLFEHAIKVTNRNFLAYAYLGLTFEKAGNVAEYLRNMEISIALNPHSHLRQVQLGQALFESGDTQGAFERYSLAVKIKPRDPEAHACLANLFENARDPRLHSVAGAVAEAGLACELNQFRRRDLLLFLAGTYARTGKFKEAKETAEMVLARSFSPREVAEANELLKKMREMESEASRGGRSVGERSSEVFQPKPP